MRRALAVLVVAGGLALATAARARAQGPISFYFGNASSDTAVALVQGATVEIPVRLANPGANTYPYYYVVAARLVVHYDPSRLTVVGAVGEPSGLSVVGRFGPGSGRDTVVASGSGYGTDAPAVRLRVQLQPGIADGAYLWLQPDSVQLYSYNTGYAYTTGLSRVGQGCHATAMWGDVDANLRVDSRDALITLSAAVGLPVTGFDLARGDVDGDGLSNSRDALMMLSYAIGISPAVSVSLNRTATGIADACPALTPPGETVVFVRSGASAGIYRLDSLSTTPVRVTAGATDLWPRLNAAGTSVVFQCPDSIGVTAVCRVGATGTGRAALVTTGGTSLPYPDWSPDGTRIAFFWASAGSIATADSLGGSQTLVPASPATTAGVAWSRDGTRLLYGNGGLWTVLATTPFTVTTIASSVDVAAPLRWDPSGLVVVFKRSDQRIWFTDAGGTGTPGPVTWFATAIGGYDWEGANGIVFAMPDGRGVSSLWMLRDGQNGPLVRLTDPGAGAGDDQPSFRRNP